MAPVEEAAEEDLTFVVDEHYARVLRESEAGAALVPRELELPELATTLIRVPNPQAAFGRLVRLFRPEPEPREGIAPTAVVETGARLGEDVALGPYAVVESGAEVGRATRIGSHTVVGQGARIGEACVIESSCSILGPVRMGDRVRVLSGSRLGTEGFGYAEETEGAVHIPQVGFTRIADDVEIGANVTVDRGALGDTVIGARTKIDNLVHVGHNVRVGRGCMIVAQVGLAGSARVGDGVEIGGQAGISGHLEIGAGARIAAQAGVIGDVPAGEEYSGYPARPHRQALRASAAQLRLPELLETVRRLRERIEVLESEEATFRVVRMLDSLEHPWAVDWLPDGRMLITERPGRMVLVDGDSTTTLSGVPEVWAQNQGGLLDVRVAPNYEESGWIYFSYSKKEGDKGGTVLARAKLDGASLTNVEEVYRQRPFLGTNYHFGSRIAFLNDGTLVVTMGERGQRREETVDIPTPTTSVGTTVRLNMDGSIPDDNPFVGSEEGLDEVYSYGHRNQQATTTAGPRSATATRTPTSRPSVGPRRPASRIRSSTGTPRLPSRGWRSTRATSFRTGRITSSWAPSPTRRRFA